MAYDSSGDNRRLLKRTLVGTLDLSGRSRRTELVYYVIACALAGVVLGFAVSTMFGFKQGIIASSVIRLALTIPVFALIVRRLHDQDRTGWWVVLPLVLFVGGIARDVRFIGDPFHSVAPVLVILLGLALQIAALVLVFLPGTAGPNRFGADPRLEE